MEGTKPPTVILYAFEKSPNVPSVSPFCQKLECHLRFADVSYNQAFTLPHKAPKKKLPYVSIGGVTVADTGFIVRYMRQRGITDLDAKAGLSDTQKAESLAYCGFWEEKVFPAVLSYRWMRKENLPIISNQVFGTLPAILRVPISWWFRRSVTRTLKMQGMGRHTPDEVDTILREAFTALEARLTTVSGNPEWFHGTSEPTDIDAVLAGMLINFCGTRANSLCKDFILGSSILRGYVKMAVERYFPEFVGLVSEFKEADAAYKAQGQVLSPSIL
ncbi:hypothetical protein DRE_04149 [Drechslerella stenobrocha 248]|uniref:Thioredoxin-like fold domain-containing protein n=1 Tax=Drechslerella stenobrocha 248 TaxID=1043628 RepID=W7I2M7_9PEZI|nr:hypothetical protein DRE_04149 [Drechslerella stenobrocha 248]